MKGIRLNQFSVIQRLYLALILFRHMKGLITFFLVLIISRSAYAQYPKGGFGGKQMNVGHFYGRVIDAATKKGIEFTTVQLTQNKIDSSTNQPIDVVVAGQLTKTNGDFSLENLSVMGEYKLQVTAMGYGLYEKKISFNIKFGQGGMQQMLNAVDKDLGNISLNITAVNLNEVVVTNETGVFEMKIDKKVYNVGKDASNAGGTAEDVLKKVPSVNVDIDGNVTMRNAAPQIMVDGRPSTLSVDQIPADAIETIEVISNPSAKYDASGGGSGILNIVLKKNRKPGYNGNIRAGIDSRLKFNSGGEINNRQGKVNMFLSGMFNQRKSIVNSETDRSYNLLIPQIDLFQTDTSVTKGFMGFGRGGFDWFINNRNTLTVFGMFNRGSFNPTGELFSKTDTVYSDSVVTTSSYRKTNSSRDFQNIGTGISFKHIYPKDGKYWSGDINFNKSKSANGGDYKTQYFGSDGSTLGNLVQQKVEGEGDVQFITAQTDFVNPVTEKIKIETGLRGALRQYNSSSTNKIYNYDSSEYQIIPSDISDYKYTDQVYAGYFTFTNQINKFGYQIGLRAESSFYTGKILSNDSTFTNSYPVSLFPSGFMSYKINDDNSFQFNYSRKINRPTFFQLLPYTDYTDSLNLSRGNPDLKPEFVNALEANYQKIFDRKNNLLISVYYKNTNGIITNYQVQEFDSVLNRGAIISTYANASSSYAYGAELTTQNAVTKWFDLSMNINAYNSYINGSNLVENLTNQQFSWFAKASTTFKIPKNFTLQASGDYRSKTALQVGGNTQSRFGGSGMGMGGGGGNYMGGTTTTAQGYTKPNYGIDASVKYEFMKNKAASISLSVSDIFKTRKNINYSSSEFFTQTVDRRKDARVFKLNFNYRFGKFDVSLFKRKNMNMDMPDVPIQ